MHGISWHKSGFEYFKIFILHFSPPYNLGNVRVRGSGGVLVSLVDTTRGP